MRVMVVEDDEDMRLAIGVSLRGAGFAVDTVGDLPQADLALSVNVYDSAVFDRMLPGGDALDYVAARRSAGWTVPVLFVTARDAVDDRVAGLACGDYLVKPFAMAELIARLRSLSRPIPNAAPIGVRRCGDLEIDTGRREVRRAGVLLTLTPKEFAVLDLLVANQGRPVSRRTMLSHAWDEMLTERSNVLEKLIAQLRQKLHGPNMIHTIRGVGYRIDPP
jgi:two-component system, OmpR family, response regulator